MIDERMEEAINKQINAELYSSYLYLSMSAYYDSIDLPGFANWFRVQAEEEKFHAMKMFDYVGERGGRVKLGAIEEPQLEWADHAAPFDHGYAHEQKVTGMINDLVNLAMEIRDHATVNFLQWYVEEQVEEEDTASSIVGKLKLIGKDGNGLFMLDKEMGTRVFTPPTKE